MDRSAEFQGGSESAREPAQFQTLQQGLNPAYRHISTLDQLMPSQNGVGDPDRQRALMGVNHSSTGQSDSTFDKHLWLRNEQPKSIYDLTYNNVNQ